jgi:tetratricopeptide (TPR) repeat protein
MQTNNAFPQAARRRTLMVLLACLGLILFAAVAYRVENPSIVQQEARQEMPGGTGQMGGGMGQMGGDMSGIASMMQKLKDNPDDVEAMRALGMSFMDMRAWDKSMSFWDMLLAKNPNDVMALNQKGFCLFELEKHAAAAELFERMLGIEPNNFHAHFNLGIIYKHYLQQPDKAVGHFQAVVDAAPDDPELVDNAKRELVGK